VKTAPSHDRMFHKVRSAALIGAEALFGAALGAVFVFARTSGSLPAALHRFGARFRHTLALHADRTSKATT